VGTGYVGIPPGRPKIIHRAQSIDEARQMTPVSCAENGKSKPAEQGNTRDLWPFSRLRFIDLMSA
jgi:hypothetical protein